MNKGSDDLYQQLKLGPFPKRKFTADRMDAIVQKAKRLEQLEQSTAAAFRYKKRWILAATLSAVILVSALLYSNWRNLGTPGPVTATPKVTIPKSKAHPQDIPITPAKLTGQLGDQLPFTEAEIKSITVQPADGLAEIQVPLIRYEVISGSLYREDLTVAKAEVQVPLERSIKIRVHTAKGVYVVPYSLDTNTFKLGNAWYYANDRVLQMMYGLLNPSSELATVERISTQAQEEVNSGMDQRDDSVSYKDDQLRLDGKDTNGWMTQIAADPGFTFAKKYYNEITNSIGAVRLYEKSGIIATDSEIIFLKDHIQTKNGIKTGMTKDEVLSRLGKPNMKTDTNWNYRSGDFSKFHLYFENNKVIYISLTMPA